MSYIDEALSKIRANSGQNVYNLNVQRGSLGIGRQRERAIQVAEDTLRADPNLLQQTILKIANQSGQQSEDLSLGATDAGVRADANNANALIGIQKYQDELAAAKKARSDALWSAVGGGLLTAAFCLGTFWLGTQAAPAFAWGLDPESNVDGFNPGADAEEINEARRQNLISRQLELNYQMLWLSGHAGIWGSEPPVRQPIGHESIQVSPNKWIYRPLYAEDVQPKAEVLPVPQNPAAPPAAQQPPKQSPAPGNPVAPNPSAPAPADAMHGDHVPPKAVPKKVPARGPRVF